MAKFVLAVDVGGTRIKYALIEDKKYDIDGCKDK